MSPRSHSLILPWRDRRVGAQPIRLHEEYGGVVPDLASREHLRNFFPLLQNAGVLRRKDAITQIAVTHGPGLAGCLALGIAFAKSLGQLASAGDWRQSPAWPCLHSTPC